MKNLTILTLFTFFFCLSCDDKERDSHCSVLQDKYDSIMALNNEYENSEIQKFYGILKREKGTLKDSVLINDYNKIKGKDSLLNLYIWDRIHTINQKVNVINVYEKFKGTYLLKPNHKQKHTKITAIKIENDSCFIYKSNILVNKDAFEIINSSNKYIEGKIIAKNYRLYLDGAIKSKLVIRLDDNSCMDCQQLQFYKID